MIEITSKLTYKELYELKSRLGNKKDEIMLKEKINEMLSTSFANQPEKIFTLSALLYVVGRYDEASNYLEMICQDEEYRDKVIFMKVLCESAMDRVKVALDMALELFGRDRSNLFLAKLITNFYLRLGEFDNLDRFLKSVLAEVNENRCIADSDYFYLEGVLHEIELDVLGAIADYKKALEIDKGNREALFRLAYLTSIYGDEDEAISLYRSMVKGNTANIGTLINLGSLYEDEGKYDNACECFKDVLYSDPQNFRGQMFYEDVLASKNIFYDEEVMRREQSSKLFLKTPILEAPLSIRARNILSQANIKTVGDLIKRSEEELKAIKNLGSQAIDEIKNMLAAKNLKLADTTEAIQQTKQAAQFDYLLAKSVTEYSWSPRARKFFEAKGIKTIEDLRKLNKKEIEESAGKSVAEEIKQRIIQMGLTAE